MRLLPLVDHTDKEVQFEKMWQDYVKELKGVDEKKHEILLFEYDNEIIGFANVFIDKECFPDEDMPEVRLQVVSFYILLEHRGHHLGGVAFKLLRQWGRDNGAAFIEIDAKTENARHFLSGQGLDLVAKGTSTFYRGFI